MKRFLICIITLVVLLVFVLYLIFCCGIYFPFRFNSEESMSIPFMTDNTHILHLQEDGNYEQMDIRSVAVTASMPGNYASRFAPNKEDYLRWFEAISNMGANTVQVYTIMDDDFYNALYTYNTEQDFPLYLLQGIQVSDAANYGAKSAYDDGFLGELMRDGLDCIDVIHGRKADPVNGYLYFCDVSQWVIGYIVGQEWNADTVAYTDHSSAHNGEYQGTYFSTVDDATSFEALLASIMDKMVSYEAKKYNTQRTISFVNEPSTDFLEYEDMYAEQLSKYAWIDAEHIIPADELCFGYFASYRTYDFCDDFLKYLSTEQTEKISSLLPAVDTNRVYSGYLDLLSAYHSMPVLLSGYGFSTARGTEKEAPLTEEEQGERLMNVWLDAQKANLTGVCISTWQDQWEKKSWNTAFAVSAETNVYWHDLQTDGQNYGLMAYIPGKEPVCLLDGDSSEWNGDTPVFEENGIALYTRYNQEALYILLTGDAVSEDNPLYIPIDMTDDLGSTSSDSPELSFDRAADFILCLNGKENTRLLVQERYNAMRENFNNEQAKGDPFVSYPDTDSSVFVLVQMAIKNDSMIDTSINRTVAELKALKALNSWNTGIFVHGNGNPSAENYNSLADFCFGNGCVEIRLPWQLINIADPVDMTVHQDYYVNYGVETEHISEFSIGVGNGSQIIALHKMKLKSLGRNIDWQEYLKKSYYVIQQYWLQ